jgi:hypothetical protein
MAANRVVLKEPILDFHPGGPAAEPEVGGGKIWPKITELTDTGVLRQKLDVTAVAGGTPTLDVTLEHSQDGVSWSTLGTFAQKTGVASEWKAFGPAFKFVRTKWAITGTNAAFTFSIAGEGV